MEVVPAFLIAYFFSRGKKRRRRPKSKQGEELSGFQEDEESSDVFGVDSIKDGESDDQFGSFNPNLKPRSSESL